MHRYANKVGALHFETSAKQNISVDDMFLRLTMNMMEKHDNLEAENENLVRRNSQRKNVVVVDDDQVPDAPSRQCCSSSS